MSTVPFVVLRLLSECHEAAIGHITDRFDVYTLQRVTTSATRVAQYACSGDESRWFFFGMAVLFLWISGSGHGLPRRMAVDTLLLEGRADRAEKAGACAGAFDTDRVSDSHRLADSSSL